MYWLAQWIYNNTIRERLPRKLTVNNDVAVPRLRLFDRQSYDHDYEYLLCDAIRQSVEPGDRVVIVGAGNGVSSVISARRAQPGGSVIAFEASKYRADIARRTAQVNGYADTIEIKTGAVGTPIHTHRDVDPEEVFDTAELPECDVLELDCEGSELEILDNIEFRPRIIVVEYHAIRDAPREAVESRLQELGYNVEHLGVEMESEGIGVVVGRRET